MNDVKLLNEFTHYLKTFLPEWDGKDHIKEYAKQVHCERWRDNGTFRKAFREWFLGYIAQLFGGYNPKVLVINGAQGLGKNLFFFNLIFEKKTFGFLHLLALAYDNPDLPANFDRLALIGIEGIMCAGNYDLLNLVKFSQTSKYEYRKPSDKDYSTHIRTASFYLTTNVIDADLKKFFETNERIFKVFNIKKIKSFEVDIYQMYAQAIAETGILDDAKKTV